MDRIHNEAPAISLTKMQTYARIWGACTKSS